ncbi:MAG: cyclic nucleotide-binding domain-containing protein, partial [Verrucomicrobia bacterium]|nr:cyclic nucleotide-binding domain-containing protein [Verrucomicrobiota bacterium]
ESNALFKNLPPKEMAMLRKAAQERRVAAGTEIFSEGGPGDGIYAVGEGVVEISAVVGGGERRVLCQLGPGEIFGEMAVVDEMPRSATARAIADTTVYFIARPAMLELLRCSAELAFWTLQEVSRRLREFNRAHLREVVQAERLAVLGNFARSIIHDLKTPLTVISLSADVICMEGVTVERRAQACDRIRKQVQRLSDMAEDVLDFTRAGPLEAGLARMNYGGFVGGILPELRTDAETRSVEIQADSPPAAVEVRIEPHRLQRVFLNLVHNAMDVMPLGGKIFIRFHADADEIATEVEDTGAGIAPEVAARLFQPFATHGKRHGTGLGLSFCKKTVEDFGGRIWVRQLPRHGAIFCFALPVAK